MPTSEPDHLLPTNPVPLSASGLLTYYIATPLNPTITVFLANGTGSSRWRLDTSAGNMTADGQPLQGIGWLAKYLSEHEADVSLSAPNEWGSYTRAVFSTHVRGL